MIFDGEAIAVATGGTVVVDAAAGPVLTDTRTLVPGAWFLALRGDRFDGHAFLDAAAEAGAAGCVVDHVPQGWSGGVVVVPDTTRALQDLGRAARDRLACPVVGLTGSSGKTTTRALIACALSPLGRVHQSVGNLNNQIGVPLTLLAAPEDAAAAVVEMGTSEPGEIAVLADICRPDVRVIVNIGPAHLEELGGLDGVALEKGALFTSARPGDTVCINVDDPRIVALQVPRGVRRIEWGYDGHVRLAVAELEASTMSTRARFVTPDAELSVLLPVLGEHVAHDAAAALAVALALGVDMADAAEALGNYQPVGMRMKREPLPHGAVALNDAYNANPASMEASLRALATLPGRRAAVLGDMLELGPAEGRWHAEVAEVAGSLGLDLLVLVGPRMSRAASHAHGHTQVWSAVDGLHLVDQLRDWLREGDVVLFKGSRGARVERILHRLNTTDGGS